MQMHYDIFKHFSILIFHDFSDIFGLSPIDNLRRSHTFYFFGYQHTDLCTIVYVCDLQRVSYIYISKTFSEK